MAKPLPWRALARIAAVGLALGLAAGRADAQRAIEVYRPAHRTAEELLPVARTALAGEGEAVVDAGTNSLLLIGSPARVQEALALVRQLDVARRTVQIAYRSVTQAQLDALGARVRWQVEAGDFRLGNARLPDDGAALRALGQRDRTGGESGGTLRILDGETGRIGSGLAAPFSSTGPRGGVDTTWVQAERGFVARPRVLGDGRVQLEISPSDDRFGPGGRIETSGAATTLIVASGETVVLGGTAQQRSASGVDAGGAARSNARDDRLLLLTVTVEGAPGS